MPASLTTSNGPSWRHQPLSPSTVDTFIETYRRVSDANDTVLTRFIQVANRFHQAGITFLLLKGADVISRLYGVRGSRPIADIDLLIHEADREQIDDVLTRIGFVQQIDGNPAYASSELGFSLDLVTTLWYLNEQELAD